MSRPTILSVLLLFSLPLSADELNLATCLTGQWPDICNHKILTKEEAEKVHRAEYSVNLKACQKEFSSRKCNRRLLSNLDERKLREANAPSERRILSSSRPTNEQGSSLAKGNVVVLSNAISLGRGSRANARIRAAYRDYEYLDNWDHDSISNPYLLDRDDLYRIDSDPYSYDTDYWNRTSDYSVHYDEPETTKYGVDPNTGRILIGVGKWGLIDPASGDFMININGGD